MGKYVEGEHVKIEVRNEKSGETELLWLLIESSDDDRHIVFGILDSEPVANADLKLGQRLAVSYDKIRDCIRFR